MTKVEAGGKEEVEEKKRAITTATHTFKSRR
jgi:hypothetical protein